MADFINTIDALGDEAVADSLIDRTITEFKDNRMTTVATHAFRGCTALTSVDLPNATMLGDNAFDGCTAMTEFEFPEVLTIGKAVFGNIKNLKSIRSPKATSFGQNNIVAYGELEELYVPKATRIESLASATSLKKEKCDFSSAEHFGGCYQNAGLNSDIIDYLPKCKTIGQQAFARSGGLVAADFPVLESIPRWTFLVCQNFRTLILRRTDAICTLAETTAFTDEGEPFGPSGTGGVLLVPSALVESYEAATNWSVVLVYENNRCLALEDYTVDGTTTGAIDWDKVDALF